MRTFLFFVALMLSPCTALFADSAGPASDAQNSPAQKIFGAAKAPLKPWQRGAFETREYRNLFAELGYGARETEEKLLEVFNEVFHGPNKVYFEVGKDMAYISDLKNRDVRT